MKAPMKRKNTLKKIMVDLEISNRELSRKSKVSEWHVSRFLCGWYPLRNEQKQRILNALNTMASPRASFSAEDVFPEVDD
jgi:predicted transcriptional regulator